MPLDAFTSRLGVGQGRLPRGDGGHVFVLGTDEPGHVAELAPGDFVELVQDVDVSDLDLIRMSLRLRTPSSLPSELRWSVALRLDGVEVARTSGRPGRARAITDLAANVSKFFGTRELAIRLELESA
jgi:hypothetical protein